MNTFLYKGSYLLSTSKKPPAGVHPFKCNKALGRLAVFAQNIHICVSAIEIRIVHRSWKLREQAKRRLGSDRAQWQNPQFTNPNPSSRYLTNWPWWCHRRRRRCSWLNPHWSRRSTTPWHRGAAERRSAVWRRRGRRTEWGEGEAEARVWGESWIEPVFTHTVEQ